MTDAELATLRREANRLLDTFSSHTRAPEWAAAKAAIEAVAQAERVRDETIAAFWETDKGKKLLASQHVNRSARNNLLSQIYEEEMRRAEARI